jgi:hypothetical protein
MSKCESEHWEKYRSLESVQFDNFPRKILPFLRNLYFLSGDVGKTPARFSGAFFLSQIAVIT